MSPTECCRFTTSVLPVYYRSIRGDDVIHKFELDQSGSPAMALKRSMLLTVGVITNCGGVVNTP